jgi:hypothetical protein
VHHFLYHLFHLMFLLNGLNVGNRIVFQGILLYASGWVVCLVGSLSGPLYYSQKKQK